MTTRVDALPAIPVRRRGETPWLRRVMVFLTCVVLADSLFGERGIAERARVGRTYAEAQRDLQAVKNENAGLREQIRRLESDPGTIEALAREEFGLIRPGEILVTIRDAR